MKNGRVHFIGIGGIGVSALARLYKSRGFGVSGSDLARSEITDALKKEGIKIFIGEHRPANVAPLVNRVIRTVAVPAANLELRIARRRGIPVQTYSEAVGKLTDEYETIAVAGAHGKSTTTALIALVLIKAGLDPTVIVGTKLRELNPPAGGSNFRAGKFPYLILEADEYRASFLNYSPAMAVVTNIDREHLDFYKNLRNIEQAFFKFLLRLKPRGAAVLNRDDPRLRRIGARLRRLRRDVRIVWFSLRDSSAAKIKKVIRVPGKHNISNALAAYAVGRLLKIPEKKIVSAIRAYRGAWRRFDYQGDFCGAKVFADYAHHPTEIKATLRGAREKFPGRRIWCVFQPHHYERTRDLFKEFAGSFGDCDALILFDIYEVAGRERKNKSSQVSSAKLATAIKRRGTPALYFPDPNRLKPFLQKWLHPGDILIMMGAGSIWEITKQLMQLKNERQKTKEW